MKKRKTLVQLFRAYKTIIHNKLLNSSFNNSNYMNNKITIINENYKTKNNNKSYSLNNPNYNFKRYNEVFVKEKGINEIVRILKVHGINSIYYN